MNRVSVSEIALVISREAFSDSSLDPKLAVDEPKLCWESAPNPIHKNCVATLKDIYGADSLLRGFQSLSDMG